MRSWVAVDITVRAAALEPVEHTFNTLGSIGTEISDLTRKESDDVCITGYFEVGVDRADIDRALSDAFTIYGLASDVVLAISSRVVPESDWLAEWKKHWQPTEIGRFVIAPPWAEVPNEKKIVIRIEPNMAFGTGTHETTQLCLRAIDEDFRGGMSFLDIGTGTGILAIAAAKISASRIAACDVDSDAVRIARDNAALNGVTDRIEFSDGSIDDIAGMFDFICANLTLDVITPLLPLLIDKAEKFLLLSGILTEQETAIRTSLTGREQPNLKFEISNLKFSYSGEWLSVLVTK
jgi:ribosomal protein L11 methyltransferase